MTLHQGLLLLGGFALLTIFAPARWFRVREKTNYGIRAALGLLVGTAKECRKQ